MVKMKMNLCLFGDGGAGAGAAPAGGTGDGGEAAVMQPGQLEDGTVVDNRLAARMEAQAKKRQARGEDPVIRDSSAALRSARNDPNGRQDGQGEQDGQQEGQPAEKSLDDEWIEAKKGKFKEQYARDVQAAVQDRFKNQDDANAVLNDMMPMLQVLMDKAGAESIEELQQLILDDDSLYEDDAEAMGMTVEGYKTYKAMQDENQRLRAQEEEDRENYFMRQHFQNLAQQAEEMKKIFPDFDLRAEMENETFRRLVAPNSGLDVHSAFFAVHHAELEPQAMQYGYKRAQQQMSQTLQANRARPVEGAMKTGTPANVAIDPKTMSRSEREKLIERARRGEKIVF